MGNNRETKVLGCPSAEGSTLHLLSTSSFCQSLSARHLTFIRHHFHNPTEPATAIRSDPSEGQHGGLQGPSMAPSSRLLALPPSSISWPSPGVCEFLQKSPCCHTLAPSSKPVQMEGDSLGHTCASHLYRPASHQSCKMGSGQGLYDGIGGQYHAHLSCSLPPLCGSDSEKC